jgi:hypothetical protein
LRSTKSSPSSHIGRHRLENIGKGGPDIVTRANRAAAQAAGDELTRMPSHFHGEVVVRAETVEVESSSGCASISGRRWQTLVCGGGRRFRASRIRVDKAVPGCARPLDAIDSDAAHSARRSWRGERRPLMRRLPVTSFKSAQRPVARARRARARAGFDLLRLVAFSFSTISPKPDAPDAGCPGPDQGHGPGEVTDKIIGPSQELGVDARGGECP